MSNRKHSIRMFGIAFVAVFAMSAMAASAASAAMFHAEEAPVTITGTQLEAHKFTANAGAISCNEASFTGESTVTETETLDIFAAYNGCTFLTVGGVKVNMGGCHYRFNANGSVAVVGEEPIGEPKEPTTCDTTPISFAASGCTVTVGSKENQNLKTLAYKNKGEGAGRTVEVVPSVTGITYTQTGVGCVIGGSGTFHNGTYNPGRTETVGTDVFGNPVGIWVE